MPGIIGGVGATAAHSLTAEHTQDLSSPSQAKQLLSLDVRVGSAENAPTLPKITSAQNRSIGERLAHAFSEFKQSFVGGIRDLISKIASCFHSESADQTETKPTQQSKVSALFEDMMATNPNAWDAEDQTSNYFKELVKGPQSAQLLQLDADEIRQSVQHLESSSDGDYRFYDFATQLAALVERAKATHVEHTQCGAMPDMRELV